MALPCCVAYYRYWLDSAFHPRLWEYPPSDSPKAKGQSQQPLMLQGQGLGRAGQGRPERAERERSERAESRSERKTRAQLAARA